MPQVKQVRVRVLRGFTGYAGEGEAKPEHLPGAVIDLDENDARAEFHIKRCEAVDPSTPLAAGGQKETTGENGEEIAQRKQAEKEAAESDLDARIAKAVADALAKQKGK